MPHDSEFSIPSDGFFCRKAYRELRFKPNINPLSANFPAQQTKARNDSAASAVWGGRCFVGGRPPGRRINLASIAGPSRPTRLQSNLLFFFFPIMSRTKSGDHISKSASRRLFFERPPETVKRPGGQWSGQFFSNFCAGKTIGLYDRGARQNYCG